MILESPERWIERSSGRQVVLCLLGFRHRTETISIRSEGGVSSFVMWRIYAETGACPRVVRSDANKQILKYRL